MRRLLALSLLSAVLLAAASASVGVTSATLTDRVTMTDEVEAASLAAPAGVAATLDDDLESVVVAWTPAAGDFADRWEVARLVGGCAGWSPPSGGATTPDVTSPHEDTAVDEGETYCYAVRGAREGWVSPYSAIGPATEVVVPSVVTLYLDGTGGSGALSLDAGTGTSTFGCLVNALGVCVTSAPASYTFASSDLFEVPTSAGWRASVQLDSGAAVALGSITITVDAWYADGACGAAPSGPSLIASGALTLNVPLLEDLDGVYAIGLAANPDFVVPETPQTICAGVRSSDPSVLGLLFSYDVVNGPSTWIEGRLVP